MNATKLSLDLSSLHLCYVAVSLNGRHTVNVAIERSFSIGEVLNSDEHVTKLVVLSCIEVKLCL